MYHGGERVTQDYGEALRLYRLAAERGVSTGASPGGPELAVASMYMHGEGVAPNPHIARTYTTSAAHKQWCPPGVYVGVEGEMADVPRRDVVMTHG